MRSWPAVPVSKIIRQPLPLRIYSTKARDLVTIPVKDRYQMYVCGITPYDATHLGHAATYLTFDLINRFWRASGFEVNYIQNITDIDDPLLERAARDGLDWRDLAHSQIELFRDDMKALRIVPPEHYEGAVDAIPDVVAAIKKLTDSGAVYKVDKDEYFEVHKDSQFGSESHLEIPEMLSLFAERGGDPNRLGKRHQLDSLLWLAERAGEPSWPSELGSGRPGWHIECAAIALKFAEQSGTTIIDIQGGGSDLIFPHHEMSASQVRVLTGKEFAFAYVHAGLIGLDGEKMSKSRGNLIFISKLISEGVDPMVIRWALLKRHYREDYMWLRSEIDIAKNELEALTLSVQKSSIPLTGDLVKEIYQSMANDLDSPRAIASINQWVKSEGSGGDVTELIDALDSLLGIVLPS